jgi:hypothetical protein
MNPLLRLLGAAASHGLQTGQIVFSAAFVGACELPNWIHAALQMTPWLEPWMTVSALFFPSGMQTGVLGNQPALAPGRRGVFVEQLHSGLGLRRAFRSGAGSPPGLIAGGAGAADEL